MHTTSTTLLDDLRTPNQQAWTKFVTLYTPLIFYWARRAGLQPADAADLVQEVFAVLVVKLPEFHYDQSKSFRAWLRTVTLNKWKELRRRRSVDVREEMVETGVDSGLEQLWETEYRRHLLSAAMRVIEVEFPKPAWEAFHQYAISGRPVNDVAQELGLSLASVYGAKSRILNRLRQVLTGLVDLD